MRVFVFRGFESQVKQRLTIFYFRCIILYITVTPKEGIMAENISSSTPPSVEQRLAGVADFMQANGIGALLVDGETSERIRYEGISFTLPSGDSAGDVIFVDGQAVPATPEEIERRLKTPGFINNVVRPVLRAAGTVYSEGGDLLDERFDVLPGFNS